MKILSIETSCDETAAAIISKDPKENFVRVLSNVIVSSLPYHSKTGGIVPEVAAREQVKYIIPAIRQAMENGKCEMKHLDAIAVTVGPGLIGSLLVGIETAKTLAYIWKKPIIPVNHLLGHIYANFIKTDSKLNAKRYTLDAIQFPSLALIVSGGHTDLVFLKNYKSVKWIGGTLDDAAGEAFDKIGRLLNLPYPGGPAIEKASIRGAENRFAFPRPMIGSKDFNFSFSGLKAAVAREVIKLKKLDKQQVADISKATQNSIIEVLVRKTIKAAKKYNVKSILLGGGVASNEKLKRELIVNCLKLKVKFFAPAKNLCTDNAAMIGAYASFNYKPVPLKHITADPQLYLL